jgi:GT2 family glycosyltransferase
VVVVDDASTDGTAAMLAEEQERQRLSLLVVRREVPGGPASAREEGWRAGGGAVIAFTDDDCVPQPDWLEAGLRALAANPGAIVQGRTQPAPWELDQAGSFSRTIDVPERDPAFQTCNVFYPREVLERVDGFDTDAFGRSPGGEDSDLAWRAIESGAPTTFAPDALVHHAVSDLGPIGKLRVAARWTTPMLAYVRHEELRRAHFALGIFWKGSHYHLVRLLIALVLPRRLRLLRVWLARPYFVAVSQRARLDGASLLVAPYYLLHDLVELGAVVRAAIRYRSPML